MAETVNVKNIGLRGVTVADTKVSFIDGEKGVLIYRGYRIEELAERSSFMEVAYLVLNEDLPNKSELSSFTNDIVKARELPEYVYECFEKLPKEGNPMDVLQATVPMMATIDPDIRNTGRSDGIIGLPQAHTAPLSKPKSARNKTWNIVGDVFIRKMPNPGLSLTARTFAPAVELSRAKRSRSTMPTGMQENKNSKKYC